MTYRELSNTLGGTVAGLAGAGLVLSNQGEDLAIASDGGFVFATPLARGASYAVTVTHQPTSPSQTCSVAAGTGVAGDASVADVAVTCTTRAFTVGGTVSGLAAGHAITVRNNGGDDLVWTTNDRFTFATAVASGQPYAVTASDPEGLPAQTCAVSDGAGTVGGDDVTVRVVCTTRAFTIGGTVSGLAGAGLVLRNNGGDPLAIAGDGAFTFAAPIASGAGYAVSIASQPAGPACVVNAASGTVASANVTSVVVTCGCGDGVRQANEEFDPPPGPFTSVAVDASTCRWHFENVAQLYCNGSCSWVGAGDCSQGDADIFCKLRTGNPNSTATSFTITTALAEPGFSCPNAGTSLGALALRGVAVDVRYQDSSILASHGAGHVITSPVCSDP